MANNKRRTLVAAGLGSALALSAIGGAGSVLAGSGGMNGGMELGSPDGYVLEVDAVGRTLLLDGDGFPVMSGDDDYEDDDYDEDDDDYELDDHDDDDDYEDEDHDEDDDDYEDGEAMAASAADADRQYALDEVYDQTSAGARLILAYDAGNGAFSGLLENTTDQPIEGVRVQVDLSDGSTLGPTDPIDLAAGESSPIALPTEGATFETFSAAAA